ncbi:MAG: hypothetical protein M0R03_18600 [Novosphingobium sp.]|nr:hypothetical protein [Novosphingobium sp.]
MKYIIYEMITPEHLKKVVPEGYGYTKTLYRNVLEKLDVSGVESEHQTLEMAMAEIVSKKDKLKQLELTILPVVTVSWDGQVS